MDHSYIRLKGLIGGPLPSRAAARNFARRLRTNVGASLPDHLAGELMRESGIALESAVVD
ncbi:hypothetical protein ABIA06_005380 [Bradyrhizobium yuanmingense]|uniref:hypothetical protein n=1 Tax=Bradyrhizobium yuanmingense TaxID=108015 RepID=UPI003510FE26